MLDLRNFKFDPISSIITLIVVPVILIARRIFVKHVKEWVTYASEGIMYIISIYIKQSIAASLSLKHYCKLQLGIGEYSRLYIPSRQDISWAIDDIFINVTIQYQNDKEKKFNHKDILSIGNRIKVMGDPGSGKSSLIKRIFRDTCKLGKMGSKNSNFPVLIELKNIDPTIIKDVKEEELGKWFYNYIKAKVSQNNVYKIEDCFDSYSTSKGLLVFLDGLDEVSSVNYQVIAQCINKLSNHLNDLSDNNVIVLTMRTQFYQQIKEDFAISFQHATFLKPFTPSDIYEFLSRWHFEKEDEKNISRIYKDLTDRPTLREMCGNPLVLSMYVAEDQASQANISPDSRTEFYKKVTEELIIKRRHRQKLSTISHTSLKEQRERILGKIAYQHLIDIDEPKNSLKWTNAISIIKEVLNCDDVKAEAIFNEISKETGLITEERSRESFRFIHLSFCEFLAAYEIAQEIADGWNHLKQYHNKFVAISIDGKSRLIEVIPFTVGLMPRVNRTQALFDVSELNDLTLTAKCFLETKAYEHETWSRFIQTSRSNLLDRSVNQFDEKWLLDLHIFNVVVRDSNLAAENLNIKQQIDLNEFYESILENEKASLNKILSAFATQDAAAVFRLCEICKINLLGQLPSIVIDNCDQIPFLGLIRDKIIQDDADSEKWAALLCESALQKKLVADLLNGVPKSDELASRIKKKHYSKIWYYKTYVPETFLTQCITICINSNVINAQTKCLSILSQINSPYENRKTIVFNYFSTFIYLIALFLFISSMIFIHPDVSKESLIDLLNSGDLRIHLLLSIVLTLYVLSITSVTNRRKLTFFYLVTLNVLDADKSRLSFLKNGKNNRLIIRVLTYEFYSKISNKHRLLLEKILELRS